MQLFNLLQELLVSSFSSQRSALSSVTVPTECRVTFQRLNLLLIRVLDGSDGERGACKIGTVTLTGANLEGLFGEAEFVTATLAGVQVLDLTAKEPLHRIILSIGGLGDRMEESSPSLEPESDAQVRRPVINIELPPLPFCFCCSRRR